MLIFYLFICTQVVLESFPVSSSGHVALLALCMDRSWQPAMTSSAYHLLHGVSACVIALFFIDRWMPLLRTWRRCWPQLLRIIMYGILTDAITSCFYLFMHWYGTLWFPLGLGFGITAGALASLYWCTQTRYTPYTWYHALILGVVQGCALLPGISRFGLTYVTARWLRIAPYRAFEISFLIEWPLITLASLASMSVLCNPHIYAQFLNPLTLLVILISGGIAWSGLEIVAYLIRIHRLWLFAFYMILPIVLWLIRAHE